RESCSQRVRDNCGQRVSELPRQEQMPHGHRRRQKWRGTGMRIDEEICEEESAQSVELKQHELFSRKRPDRSELSELSPKMQDVNRRGSHKGRDKPTGRSVPANPPDKGRGYD